MTELAPQPADRTSGPEALARAAMAKVDAHDLDGLRAVWHPDLELHFVATGKHVNRDGARAEFAEIFAAFPDFRIAPTGVLTDGDTAIVEWEGHGSHTGVAYQGIARTGRRIELRGVDLMQFSDGLLWRNTVYYDGLSVARGLGLLPPDGTAQDRAVKGLFNVITRLRHLIRR